MLKCYLSIAGVNQIQVEKDMNQLEKNFLNAED